MWGSKGRSGYGDSTIGGDYDSWDGVSPNGKQYKNEATMETRDLSGADYWHCRKQNRPSEEIPVELHMLSKGRANINAYAIIDEPLKKTSRVPLKARILPQASRVEKLRSEAIELEAAFKAGEFSADEYTLLRSVAFRKLHRAEELLKKAITPTQKEEEAYEDSAEYAYETFSTTSNNNGHGESFVEEIGVRFIDELSDENSLKGVLKMSCKVVRKAVQLSQAARNYYNELKGVYHG